MSRSTRSFARGAHESGLGTVAFNSASTFVTEARGGHTFLWANGRLRGCWNTPHVETVAIHPSGRLILARGEHIFISTGTAPEVRSVAPIDGGLCAPAEWIELEGHDGRINALSLVRDEMVSASDDGTLILWDLAAASASETSSARRALNHFKQ